MDENQVTDTWGIFKEYLDKKSITDVAERYVDLLVDYGVSDETLKDCLGHDDLLDGAIEYYLDEEESENEVNEDWE